MKFTSLKDLETSDISFIENKQRIKLSEQAVAIILSDLDVFRGSDQAYTSVKNILSADLNRIFERFRENAMASVAVQKRKEKFRLDQVLEGYDLEVYRPMIASIIADYEKKLLEGSGSAALTKGESFTFRINAKNLRYLASDDGQEEGPPYNNNIGRYMTAVFEEYSRLSYFEREGYYYKDEIRCIKQAISERKLLKITLRSINMSTGTQKHNVQYVKPFQITENPVDLYHYIVGVMSASREGPWKVGSIRLTSIFNCDIQEQHITHYARLKEDVDAAIRKKGIPFLSDNQDAVEVVVQFTPRGERMYKSILHLRPRYSQKADNRVYTFHCAFTQARNYFFKFGKEVRILAPKSMAVLFAREYNEAADKYQQSDT